MPQFRLTPPVLYILAVADDLVLSSAYVKTLDDWNKLISKPYQLSGNAVAMRSSAPWRMFSVQTMTSALISQQRLELRHTGAAVGTGI